MHETKLYSRWIEKSFAISDRSKNGSKNRPDRPRILIKSFWYRRLSNLTCRFSCGNKRGPALVSKISIRFTMIDMQTLENLWRREFHRLREKNRWKKHKSKLIIYESIIICISESAKIVNERIFFDFFFCININSSFDVLVESFRNAPQNLPETACVLFIFIRI